MRSLTFILTLEETKTKEKSNILQNVPWLICSNFASGSAGFKVQGSGNAEFNDVTVRGALIAGSGSSVNGTYLTNSSVTYGKIAANAVRTNELYVDSNINFSATGTQKGMYGVTRITYGTSISDGTKPYIDLEPSNITIHSGATAGYDVQITAQDIIGLNAGTAISLMSTSGDITLDSVDGRINLTAATYLYLTAVGNIILDSGDHVGFKVPAAANRMYLMDWQGTGGANNNGYLDLHVDGAVHRISFDA